jgi:CRISPR/Cas system-associated exonuclease Cas4 (RecB family)
MKQKNKNQQESGLELNSFIKLEESFSHIKFFSKNHTYTIDDKPAKTSVSGLLKKYEKPFERDKIATYVAERDQKKVDEVIAEWEFAKNYSCHKGSEFHLFVENYFSRKQTTIDIKALKRFYKENENFYKESSIGDYYKELAHLIKNFLNFYNWWKNDYFLLKSEFVVGDKESGICGTIDNLSYNKKTNELIIFDYKTNKEIKKKNPRDDTFLEPIQYLSQCEYIKYSLQLWLYQIIIERNSEFKVPKSYIVWVANKENYELMETLNLRKEAEVLLDQYK